MQIGSEDYQIHDSYFVVGDGFLYIVIGVLIIAGIITFTAIKKVSRKRKKDRNVL